MALVFKVKFQDSLRRWVASETLDADSFTVTFKELDAKIRELFLLSPSASFVITYVDKENDVVTVADDQDLIDACIVQQLNPLRLDVKVLDGSFRDHRCGAPYDQEAPPMPAENLNLEAFLNALPQATVDAVKGFMHTYAPFIDPKLPAAACLGKVENAFKEFVNGLGNHHHGQQHRHHQGHHRGHHHEHHHGHHHEHYHGRHREHHHGHDPGHPKPGEKSPHHANRHPWSPAFHPHHTDSTVHWGIECDGCGISPIEGSRYKSTKENDYDLCECCFKDTGNESDYVKLDLPAHHPPPHGHYRPPCLRKGPKPFVAASGCRASFARGPYGWKPSHPFMGHQTNSCSPGDEHKKLDARFVKDVTIFDGTELPPASKFTKIWRLSNIGTLPWPQSTRLVHIGGDVLGMDKAVVLELPENGLPCGEEVEVSVDLVAPEKAGRYVSHWRLSAPSGQKFGHRVWVVIQVVPHGEHSPQLQASLEAVENSDERSEEVMDLDSNIKNTRTIDVDLRTIDMDLNGADKVLVDVVVDGVTAIIEQVSVENSGPIDHENNTTIVYPDLTSFHIEDETEKPKLEVDGFSLVEKPSESAEWFDVSDQTDSLLQTLEIMGFTDNDLNMTVLRSCNFDLEKTVDDLLVAAGWDGILKDLEEMGFSDKLTNARLLVKNKGSLKQCVKDLVKLEKAFKQ